MNEADEKQNVAGLRTLERGLDVLDCFCAGSEKLSLTEISVRISLSPSTATRILATLEKRRYITRSNETKKYQLGSQILCLLSQSLQGSDLRSVAMPFMEQLNQQFNESVTLYVVMDNQRVCLDRVETTHNLRRVVNIGDRLPLTRGAGGKVLLAWLPEKQKMEVWSTDPVIPLEELENTKKQGFAVSAGEREQGVGAVAAPVFDANRQVVAALSIAAPTIRLTQEAITEMIPAVIDTARKISAALGYKN